MKKSKLTNLDYLHFFEAGLKQNKDVVNGYIVYPIKAKMQTKDSKMIVSVLKGFLKVENVKKVNKAKAFNQLLQRYVHLKEQEEYKGKFQPLKIRIEGLNKKLRESIKQLDIELNPERKAFYEEEENVQKQIVEELTK